MRTNVYFEEMTQDVQVVAKHDHRNAVLRFGVRFFLHSHPNLGQSDPSDERSAVTFWANEEGKPMDHNELADILLRASNLLRMI